MKTAWMPTNRFTRRKADAIPEAVWDLYKADIIAQYHRGGKRNGIALAMKWVISQDAPDLKPSRRQLDSRLKRWISETKDMSSTLASESSWSNDIRASPGSFRTVMPDSLSRDHTPDTAIAGSDGSEDSSATQMTIIEGTPLTNNTVLNPLSSVASNTSSSTKSEATYDDPTPEDHDCVAFQGLSKGRIRAALSRINIKVTREQLPEIALGSCPHDDSLVAMHEARIDEAAKFLGAIKPGADVFVLYFVLLAFNSDCPAPSGKRLLFLQQAALCACSSKDRHVVHSLVSREMRILEELPNTEQDCLMLRILQAHVAQSLANVSEPKVQNPTSTDKSCPSRFAQQDICVDSKLGMSMSYNRFSDSPVLVSDTRQRRRDDSRHDRHHPDLRPLWRFMMSQWSASPGSRGSSIRDNCMRKCLSWCSTTLSPWSWFDKTPWQLMLAQEHLDLAVGELLGVYWLLWTDWQQNRGQVDVSSFYDVATEQAIGMSASSMLLELVRLALDFAPKQGKRSRSHRAFGRDYWETLRRVSSGFQRLLKMSDVELAQLFTKHFMDNPGPTFCTMSVRLSIKVFNQQLQATASTADISSSQPEHPAFAIGGNDTVMRWSDNGSDISSMRRHKRKCARLSMSTLSSSKSLGVMTASLFESVDVKELLGIPVRLLPPAEM